jgi:hypothetical protein
VRHGQKDGEVEGGDLEMFGRKRIDEWYGIVESRDDNDRAMRFPRGTRHRRSGEGAELHFDRRSDVVGEGPIVGDEDRLARRIMFGLTEKVGGDAIRIVRSIRQDDNLGWTRDHVDSTTP